MPSDPGLALLLLTGTLLYATGVVRLTRRGRRWSRARSAAFALAAVAVGVASASPVAAADTTSFPAHMVQHLLLGMVAPLGLALSAPVTLALQAAQRPTKRALLAVLHGRVVAVVTHPAVGWTLFGGSLFVLYFTPLLDLSLRNGLVHGAVHLHLLAAGSLFLWPALGVDPVRWRLPHPARLLLVLLAVPFHAIVGLALLGASVPAAPAFYDLAGQRTAAGILWATGDLFGLAAAGIVVAQWMRADERAAAREDRRLDAAAGLREERALPGTSASPA